MTKLCGSTALWFALLLAGCGNEAWQPPAPSGGTYQYAAQGFAAHGVTAFGGAAPGVAYGGAFTFREKSGVVQGRVKDPFIQSAPIDGIQFNEHLAGRGVRLEAGGVAPSAGHP